MVSADHHFGLDGPARLDGIRWRGQTAVLDSTTIRASGMVSMATSPTALIQPARTSYFRNIFVRGQQRDVTLSDRHGGGSCDGGRCAR